MNLKSEIKRRRTFAIISHPDAGKTTLTEKFLLYGGAIHLAGSVKDRKAQRDTASDWMELERQRGISISSTVLQFDYKDCRVNLLDTPGHRDFSEDTYRVLMAVDAAVMVLDAAKGIEAQTLKLFQVCRQRGIPIFTFINKCDRPSKDGLEILDEIETTLGLKTFPVNWPIGFGPDFRGLFDRIKNKVHWFEKTSGGRYQAPVEIGGFEDPKFVDKVPAQQLSLAQDELALLEEAGSEFNRQEVMEGRLTPVYFGSAVNNFGVQLLLDGFLEHAPIPQSRESKEGLVTPEDEVFSAFIFKIQANMDPNHRDRLVFFRVCSGVFRRDMQVTHVQSGKKLRLSFSHKLFGRDRVTQDEAYPGDIVGISGHSDLGIGDTLTDGNDIRFESIPPFAPECFSYLNNIDTNNFKRFRTGVDQLLQEKIVQRFQLVDSVRNVPLIGAVGPLQFEVVQHRMEGEYNCPTRLEPASWSAARWVEPELTENDLRSTFVSGVSLAKDAADRFVLLFEGSWNLDYFVRQNPEFKLYTSPKVVE